MQRMRRRRKNSFDLAGLNVEGGIPVYKNGKLLLNKLQVITDNGNDIYYSDTVSAKDLSADNFKKFSSVFTESPQQGLLPVTNNTFFSKPFLYFQINNNRALITEIKKQILIYSVGGRKTAYRQAGTNLTCYFY